MLYDITTPKDYSFFNTSLNEIEIGNFEDEKLQIFSFERENDVRIICRVVRDQEIGVRVDFFTEFFY